MYTKDFLPENDEILCRDLEQSDLSAEQIKNVLFTLFKNRKTWVREPTSASSAQALSRAYFLHRYGINEIQLNALFNAGLISCITGRPQYLESLTSEDRYVFPHSHVQLKDKGLEIINAYRSGK